MRISVEGFDLRYKGRPIAGYNAVIPRIGASITRYGNAVLHQFELMGSFTPNPSSAIMRARDKLRSHQLLAAPGIGLPVTVFRDRSDEHTSVLQSLMRMSYAAFCLKTIIHFSYLFLFSHT